ncbi:hypothetical protein BKA65DRAFT_553354 [Rhexocercosporidium sp. MPI-PUGE-AT-0058]|nr:hypothetical protein BKA65DRAFT_553354 [Rhexocercosporidium sp. MPI-PUGE-AT-0058]
MTAASETPSASPPDHVDGPSNKKRAKKRVRAFTADERANHRVIEKQRREALNDRFLDLARLIPALANSRRLSKSIIVHESIEHLQVQRTMCLAAASEVQTILAENLELIAEVNRWRERFPGIESSPREPKPIGEAMLSLMKVDREVFGTFPGGFGDNSQVDAGDEDHSHSQPRIEDRRDPMPNPLPIIEAPNFSIVHTDRFPQTFVGDGHQPLEAATRSINTLPVPNLLDSTPASGSARFHHPDTLSEDPFTFVDNLYGPPLDSNHGILSAANDVGDLNMDHSLFLDFPMPLPELNYLSGDTSHFGFSA